MRAASGRPWPTPAWSGGAAQTIALYDLASDKVAAEVLDLQHGLQFVPRADVIGSDDVSVCADADVVIVTAGAKQKPGQTRLELAEANVTICRTLVPQLLEVAPEAVLLMVTNPVDVVTYAAIEFAGLPAGRVFGSGTVLDSSRPRHLVGRHCGVAVQNVHAWIAGEHGDSEIPLWSSASIGAIPLDHFREPGHPTLDEAAKRRITHEVVTAAENIIRGKGATNYAVGLAEARIVEAIVNDENRVLPVSTLLDDYQGIDDVCLSVPCIVNRNGVDAAHPGTRPRSVNCSTHQAEVWRFARRRCPSEHDADDVVADTFAIAWRRWDALPADGVHLRLLAVARRVLANQRRSLGRLDGLRRRIEATGPGVFSSDPADTVVEGDRHLWRALASLAPDDRDLLIMRAWDELAGPTWPSCSGALPTRYRCVCTRPVVDWPTRSGRQTLPTPDIHRVIPYPRTEADHERRRAVRCAHRSRSCPCRRCTCWCSTGGGIGPVPPDPGASDAPDRSQSDEP